MIKWVGWVTLLHFFFSGDFLEVREGGGKVSKLGKGRDHDLCDQESPVGWMTAGHLVTIALTTATPGHGYALTYTVEPGTQEKTAQGGLNAILCCPDSSVT
jgi:hypothetical protein